MTKRERKRELKRQDEALAVVKAESPRRASSILLFWTGSKNNLSVRGSVWLSKLQSLIHSCHSGIVDIYAQVRQKHHLNVSTCEYSCIL